MLAAEIRKSQDICFGDDNQNIFIMMTKTKTKYMDKTFNIFPPSTRFHIYPKTYVPYFPKVISCLCKPLPRSFNPTQELPNKPWRQTQTETGTETINKYIFGT